MLGAIIGDIAGSFREFSSDKHANLPLLPTIDQLPSEGKSKVRYGITDDSLLTIATAQTLLQLDGTSSDPQDLRMRTYINQFAKNYHMMGNKYKDPIGGFGGGFRAWLNDPTMRSYLSCGNGSAMRVSPVGWVANNTTDLWEIAQYSAMPTHDHPEGIKGAMATAMAIFLARQSETWTSIADQLDDFAMGYEPIEGFDHFDKTCQETMRIVFHILDTTDNFHDAVFKAVTTPNGDSDTLGAIVGSIAEPLYGIPDEYKTIAINMIPKGQLRNITVDFVSKYCVPVKK